MHPNADLCSVLRRALEAQGMTVRTVSTGHQAVEAFSASPPDLLVLDIGPPDSDGRDVCPAQRVRVIVRIAALLRRADHDEERLEPPGVLLDPATHAIRIGDRSQPLTPTEFRLFAALAARPGDVVRRDEMIAAGWPETTIVHDHTLHTYVGRLRRKLRDLESPQEIATTHGVGYALR
jgi:two-component system, OmpR family, response regulator